MQLPDDDDWPEPSDEFVDEWLEENIEEPITNKGKIIDENYEKILEAWEKRRQEKKEEAACARADHIFQMRKDGEL
jgi:hypothetical protein